MERQVMFLLRVAMKTMLATVTLFFCFHFMNDGLRVLTDSVEWQRCANASLLMVVLVLGVSYCSAGSR